MSNQRDLRDRAYQTRIKREVLSVIYTRARAEYEEAARDAHEAFTALMDAEEATCRQLIKSGKDPIYCKLQRGHEGEHAV